MENIKFVLQENDYIVAIKDNQVVGVTVEKYNGDSDWWGHITIDNALYDLNVDTEYHENEICLYNVYNTNDGYVTDTTGIGKFPFETNKVLKIKIVYILNMWNEFSNIPVNNNDEIEVDFYDWEAGTDRVEILSWFDERIPTGIKTMLT